MSTSSNAGCLAASMARRTPAMSLATPVEVSLWTMQTALMVWCGIFLQALLDGRWIGRLTLVATQEFRFDSKLIRHLLP